MPLLLLKSMLTKGRADRINHLTWSIRQHATIVKHIILHLSRSLYSTSSSSSTVTQASHNTLSLSVGFFVDGTTSTAIFDPNSLCPGSSRVRVCHPLALLQYRDLVFYCTLYGIFYPLNSETSEFNPKGLNSWIRQLFHSSEIWSEFLELFIFIWWIHSTAKRRPLQ